jgi:hypothetical protein
MEPREKLLKKLPDNGIMAEIGVWEGLFSKKILDNNVPRMLYLIDPWLWDNDSGISIDHYIPDIKVANSQNQMNALYKKVVMKFSEHKNVIVLRMKSVDAARQFEDKELDCAYIDGSHDFPSIEADLKAWSHKVKIGGYLAGDDYKWGSETIGRPVKRAVTEFLEKRKDFAEEAIIETQFILQRTS